MIVKDFLEEKLSNYPRINKLVKSGKLSIYNIPIVVYCAHSKCHASENLIEHLIEAGFVNLLEYPGGSYPPGGYELESIEGPYSF